MSCRQCKSEPVVEGFTLGEKCIRHAMGGTSAVAPTGTLEWRRKRARYLAELRRQKSEAARG